MGKKGLTLKIFFLILVTDLGESVAQLFMKQGLTHTGITVVNPSTVFDFVIRNAASPLIWSGLFLYALTFFIWIVVLSHVDLSLAMPVASTSYVLIPFIAMIFLHESVTPSRWIGIFLIILGIRSVSKSKQQIPMVT